MVEVEECEECKDTGVVATLQEDINKVVKMLEVHGKEIGRKAIEEDSINCKNIVNYYRMLKACPEGMMLVLLEYELNQYLLEVDMNG